MKEWLQVARKMASQTDSLTTSITKLAQSKLYILHIIV